jgi:nitrogen fixation/metabolism regulation signal transduction histidine kinase
MIEELTAEILAAEKKAYGKVIRMMAHEVNNTIGPVNSILQTALGSERLWTGMNGNSLRNALQVAYDRNTSLSIFMKNFTEVVRLPEPKKVQIDLHQLITRVSDFTAMMTGEKRIQFKHNFDESPFFIMADEHQMEQVLINVIKNSIEAIEQEGTITFTTNTSLSELVIADDGRGLKEDADQLFSPFFSTKKDGQGIGLTLVKEILINHGYEFSLQSQSGETRFVFIFGK